MSEINDSRIDSLPPEDNRNQFKDKVIQCSWGLNVIHYKSTGKLDTIIIFHDEDHGTFKFNFSLGNINDLQLLIDQLKHCQVVIRQIIKGKN